MEPALNLETGHQQLVLSACGELPSSSFGLLVYNITFL